MKKNLKVLLAAALCSCSLSMVTFAGTWQVEGTNWKYQNDDSSYAANGWITDNGKWYYFDANGYMMTGWVFDNQSWYYLNPSGEMRMEPLVENQVTYYFDAASGVCTNPDAAKPAVAGTLTEQQYLDYIEEFIGILGDASDKAMKELDNLNKGDVWQAKLLLTDLKTPFVQFFEVQAPARFAQAHEHYKNGCVAMVQYLDICIQLVDSDNLSSSQILDLYNQMMATLQVLTDEFDMGDRLFWES